LLSRTNDDSQNKTLIILFPPTQAYITSGHRAWMKFMNRAGVTNEHTN